MIYYKPGHSVAAAATRGKVHAFEHVVQAWNDLSGRGMSDEAVAAFALPLWLEYIEHWAAQEIDPAKIHVSPWMSHMLDEEQIVAATREYPHRDLPEPAPGAAMPVDAVGAGASVHVYRPSQARYPWAAS